jgi:hypothetical protein
MAVQGYEYLGTVTGENTGDQFGSAMCIVDFNADGFSDLAISAPANDDSGLSAGKVYLFYGGPNADLAPDLTFTGVERSFFGNALSSAGDHNHDGHEDLLIGAPFYDIPATSAGAVFLFYGGPITDNVVDHIYTGEAESDYFGTAVSSAGDFNNDGHDDIVIGAYRADWGTFENAGKGYVYFGGPSHDFSVDLILAGEADGERFGFALSSGDYNGDNVGDIIAGAYSYDNIDLNVGRMYLFYGENSADSIFDLTITGIQAGEKYGWSLTSGNINNDPYEDILMGSDGYQIDNFSVGRVYLFYGAAAMDNTLDDSYTLGRQEDDYLGFSVHSGIDINDDGYDDIVAGMPGNDDGAMEAGGFKILLGPATLTPDAQFLGDSTGEELGSSVILWPDYYQSGNTAIAGGASDYNDFQGRVFFYVEEIFSGNRSPVLEPIENKKIVADFPLLFNIYATDADGDIVTLTAENLPEGASFIDNGWNETAQKYSGTFSWTPNVFDVGEYPGVSFIASDAETGDTAVITISVIQYLCGDANGDASVNVGDAVFEISYIFRSGASPDPLCEGDANGDGLVNVGDVVYIISYVFREGESPIEPCCP